MYQPYQTVPTRIISGTVGTATVQQRYIAVRREYSIGTAQRVGRTRINRQARHIWYGEYSKIQVRIILKKSDFSDEKDDDNSGKADFGKMIGDYTSKHMICVHKSAFSAVSATRRSEKLCLLGTYPQTPHSGKMILK